MKKYNYVHCYDEKSKKYHNYYGLVDVVNSMSSFSFVKNVKHAIALSMFKNGYSFKMRLSEEKLRKEYYWIKTANDKHLIGTTVFDFEHCAHHVMGNLSVQVIDKQLKFVIYYTCNVSDEEIQTENLGELYHQLEKIDRETKREEEKRKKQLAADLVSLGVLGLEPIKKKKKQQCNMEEIESICVAE